jgi:ABC-2 type transport system ATP-binding protein
VQLQLESDPSALSARIDDPGRAGAALTQLTAAGIAVSEFALGQPSLDAVFLALTGHAAEPETTEEAGAA